MADQDSENVENMDYEDSHSESSSEENVAEKTNSDEEEELDSKQLSFKPNLDSILVVYCLLADQEINKTCVVYRRKIKMSISIGSPRRKKKQGIKLIQRRIIGRPSSFIQKQLVRTFNVKGPYILGVNGLNY
jgi:hypothetical protein